MTRNCAPGCWCRPASRPSPFVTIRCGKDAAGPTASEFQPWVAQSCRWTSCPVRPRPRSRSQHRFSGSGSHRCSTWGPTHAATSSATRSGRIMRSEHATANAIDIAGFRLENGDSISVLKDWREQSREAMFLREVHRRACRYSTAPTVTTSTSTAARCQRAVSHGFSEGSRGKNERPRPEACQGEVSEMRGRQQKWLSLRACSDGS